jgi:ferrochelatase
MSIMVVGEYRMAFQLEPSFQHGQAARTAVLYCNLGTPSAPTAPALRKYLAEFLGDSRVVEIPKPIWWLILHGIILRVRPAKSAAKYASIWTEQGSPLKAFTEQQAQSLGAALQARGHHVSVRYAMRYGQPSVAAQLNALKAEGVQRVLILPAYPQYSGTTTASVFDAVYRWGLKTRLIPELRFVNHYHDDRRYIAALAQTVREHWAEHGRSEQLVMSFHGVPERTLQLGDPYHCECLKTGRLLAEALGLSKDQYKLTFQSRFGKAKWLEPYTEPTMVAMAGQGVKSIDVICPGFTSDCLETLEEIQLEAKEAFLHAGGEKFSYIPCLNNHAQWIEALADISLDHMQTWDLSAPDEAALAASRTRALAQGSAN